MLRSSLGIHSNNVLETLTSVSLGKYLNLAVLRSGSRFHTIMRNIHVSLQQQHSAHRLRTAEYSCVAHNQHDHGHRLQHEPPPPPPPLFVLRQVYKKTESMANNTDSGFSEAPAPWKRKGECFWLFGYVKSEAYPGPSSFHPLEGVSSFADPAKSGIYQGGVAYLMVTRYSESPCGMFLEFFSTSVDGLTSP